MIASDAAGTQLYCGKQEITTTRAHSGSKAQLTDITDTSCSLSNVIY